MSEHVNPAQNETAAAAEAKGRRSDNDVQTPERPTVQTSQRSKQVRVFTAPSYWHTTHPDTGEHVVFAPGEALPPWAITGRLDELIGPNPFRRSVR